MILINLGRGQDLNPSVCTSNGNYTSNSTYGSNLKTLLHSMSSNMSEYGFYTSSLGLNQDRANAFALCRADQTIDQCRDCVEAASHEILQRCPNQRQAVLWFEVCTLRYSNNPIHNLSLKTEGSILYNTMKTSNAVYFREDVLSLLVDKLLAATLSLRLAQVPGLGK